MTSLLKVCAVLTLASAACIAESSNEQIHVDGQLIALAPEAAMTDAELHHERAVEELKEEEHQRIAGLIPDFNAVNDGEGVSLSSGQKFSLAERTALDPSGFAIAAIAAGLGQTSHQASYGQGMGGFSKRFAAANIDGFTSNMLGGAVLPAVLKQDPRYFRKGAGSFGGRLLHALASTVICRDDSGKAVLNYSNVIGNFAAGGIANLYSPASDRGMTNTLQRSFALTAEGAIGAVFMEFWPDISRKLVHHKRS